MRLEEQYLEHLGHATPIFPRQIAHRNTRGHFTRRKTRNPHEYVERVNTVGARTNTYAALYTPHQRRAGKWDKVYLDIDSADFNQAHAWMQSIVAESLSRYSQKPRVYCSGAKGFSVYYDFKPAEFDLEKARLWAEQLAEDAGAQIDTSVLGDPRRVSRIPYTYNYNAFEKVGRPTYCIPVDPEWGADRVWSETENPRTCLPVELTRFPEVAAEIRDMESLKARDHDLDVGDVPIDNENFRRQLEWLADNAGKVQDGRTRMLGLVISRALYNLDMDKQDIHAWCKKWVEKSGARYTRKYRGAVENGVKQAARGDPPWNLDTFLSRYGEVLDVIV